MPTAQTTATGAGVIATLVLFWWGTVPVFQAGEWPVMTEIAAGAHGLAIWWAVGQIVTRWRGQQPEENS